MYAPRLFLRNHIYKYCVTKLHIQFDRSLKIIFLTKKLLLFYFFNKCVRRTYVTKTCYA